MEHIRRFGRFNIDNYKFYADPTFAIEDYICPDVDHELMYKCLKGLDDVVPNDIDQQKDGNGSVVLDMGGQLIERSNDQRIVHMTVEQSQDLLDQQTKSLRKFEMFMSGDTDNNVELGGDDEKIAKLLIDNLNKLPQTVDTKTNSSSIVAPAKKVSVKKTKRKIKINQYNGTINLKNISNLTINTVCSRDTPNAFPLKPILSADDSPAPFDEPPTSYGCDFYNRLINEIKHSIHSTTTSPATTSSSTTYGTHKNSPTTPSSQSFSAASTPTTSPPFDCNRMLFQNIRNLKINLPAATAARSSLLSTSGTEQPPSDERTTNDPATDPTAGSEGDDQPVQIEQWLKQIITQTEVEPVPPSMEILEHSLITCKGTNCAQSN